MSADTKQHRIDLLSQLSGLLARLRLLREAEGKLENTKRLMGKGGARKVRKEGWVEDGEAPEDRDGERKRWDKAIWKWKLERRK